jgi:hypothetical protein
LTFDIGNVSVHRLLHVPRIERHDDFEIIAIGCDQGVGISNASTCLAQHAPAMKAATSTGTLPLA